MSTYLEYYVPQGSKKKVKIFYDSLNDMYSVKFKGKSILSDNLDVLKSQIDKYST